MGKRGTVHCSFNANTKCEKVKFRLHDNDLVRASSTSRIALSSVLDAVTTACLSTTAHVMDRGHKHSSGVIEVSFYRRPAAALSTKEQSHGL